MNLVGIDSRLHGTLGISFIAFAPFVGIAVCVYMFGKISMAHFNPAVTLGFLITKHITKIQLVYYLCAEIIGALLGSLFVKYAIGFVYKNENMTVRNEGPSSVVAFLPRLTPGGNVSINVSNFDSFYGSIVATYDQGSNQFINLQPSGILGVLGSFYYRESLQSLILIALTFLSFGIAFRLKRRGRSKLASDILKDIMKVRKTYAVMGQTSNEIEIIYTSNNSSTLLDLNNRFANLISL